MPVRFFFDSTLVLITPFPNAESVPVSLPGFPVDLANQERTRHERSIGRDRLSWEARYTLARYSKVSNSHQSHMIKTGVEMGGLANNCLGLISTLASHVDGLTELSTGPLNKDRANAVSLRSSLVNSLAALAEVLDLMSRISPEPLATDYQRQCIAALTRAAKAVHGLGHEGFTAVGTFFGVRWPRPGQLLSFNNPELTLAVQISLKRLSTLLSFTISRLYRTPIEGIDVESLNSGAVILAEAKEGLRVAFPPSISPLSPDLLTSKLSELFI